MQSKAKDDPAGALPKQDKPNTLAKPAHGEKESEIEDDEDGDDDDNDGDDENSEEPNKKTKREDHKSAEPMIPKILISRISPPLYINSRKLAKESSTKKYHTVIEPFDLQAVDQDLYIRSNKIHQRVPNSASINEQNLQIVNEEKITPDIFGLINYFSAPNIRNKIRHPLFLALKFHRCVTLYYNPKKIGEPDQKSIAIKLHRDLQ